MTVSVLDSNESIFFSSELEHVKSKAYQKEYPENMAFRMFPISRVADPADEEISYDMYDTVGVAKIVANYADDIPISDVKADRFTSRVKSIAGAYEYSVMDIKAAARTGKPLNQMKANATREANDKEVNDIAFFGNEKYGLVGLFNHPNITAGAVAVGATSGASKFSEKTSAEMYLDMANAINDQTTLTNGIERPNRLALPVEQYGIVSVTQYSTASDLTVLEYFKRQFPDVEVMAVPQLKAVNPLPSGDTGPKDVMVVWKYDEDRISLEIPLDYEQFGPQQVNLAYKVFGHSRCGGLIITRPLSVSIIEGI